MAAKPLKDKEAFTIRTELIQKLADKNQELQAQIEKIEQEIYFNNQIIGQLREITPPEPLQGTDPTRWKRLARKLQAGIEQSDPSKRKRKQVQDRVKIKAPSGH
jgi:hypothetical protein